MRHISKVMCSFAEISSPSPPNLLLVLSKTCLEMEQNGVHILVNIRFIVFTKNNNSSCFFFLFKITLVDDLYEIDSENSAVLTHETEICAEMRETAQTLLDAYVRLQGANISQVYQYYIIHTHMNMGMYT